MNRHHVLPVPAHGRLLSVALFSISPASAEITFSDPLQPEESIARYHHSGSLHLLSCDQVHIVSILLIDPCHLLKFAEIEQTDQLVTIIFPDYTDDGLLVCIQSVEGGIGDKYFFLCTDLLQLLKTMEYAL